MSNRSLLIAYLIVSMPGLVPAGETPRGAEQVRFFETRIRPLLAERCYECHGATKQKGGLRLDSRERIFKGGKSDLPAVVPGDPEKSLLIKAVRYGDADLKMPPKRRLPDAEVADLVRWVKAGAPYPESTGGTAVKATIEAGRHFWAFQAPVKPSIPIVKKSGWAEKALDRFVLARLEANGLIPAPPADKRTLIRRATFDLIGLPPTVEEIDAFLADHSPEAFARVVDRLLASPHYGERWGRHWLDVARYADSNGLDENVAHGNAWRYRDYVVDAFNKDKPYDRFVLEQLAGDLLADTDGPPARQERLIGTGFLSLGPKVLAEVDEKKMEMDIVDEQVDTVGRAFLGLTLGCARCHDHKFDPIETEDYYGLAGIFTSTRTMENFTKVARWYEHSIASEKELAKKKGHDQRIAQCKLAIQSLVNEEKAKGKVATKIGTPGAAQGKAPKPEKNNKAELKTLQEQLAQLEKEAPVLSSAMGVSDGKTADLPIHIRGSHLKLGRVVPRHIPVVFSCPDPPRFDKKQSGRLELAQWLVRPDHPLTSRVMVNRIWRWHFGQGLVRTPDNFGKLGDRPSDPALFDWLARQFIEMQWSIKSMHRLIMLSNTYQMGSDYSAQAAAADPENRLHWRSDVRRLEAEEIRDTLLAVSGKLDGAVRGSLLTVKNRDYLFDHTSKDQTRYESQRRSIYLPVIRNNLYDVFQLFDSTDAAVLNGDRATTTVAPQALFMMNSDFMLRACDGLAGALCSAQGDDRKRVDGLYLKAYGRPATPEEEARGLALIESVQRALQGSVAEPGKRSFQAWSCLCQVVMAADEFIYVR